MGTNYNGDDNGGGIIPQVMDTIFRKIDTETEKAEFLIRVSFIEVSWAIFFLLLRAWHYYVFTWVITFIITSYYLASGLFSFPTFYLLF